MVILDGYEVTRLMNLSCLLKIVKNFKKNVNFGLQGDFIMEINFNCSDRSFELSNWRYDAQALLHLCLYKYHSVTIYIYIYRCLMVLVQARMQWCLCIVSPIRKFKWSIRPLKLIFILKSPWRSNFTFFWNFLLFLRDMTNSLI